MTDADVARAVAGAAGWNTRTDALIDEHYWSWGPVRQEFLGCTFSATRNGVEVTAEFDRWGDFYRSRSVDSFKTLLEHLAIMPVKKYPSSLSEVQFLAYGEDWSKLGVLISDFLIYVSRRRT